jgi:hypothetical protein
MKGSKGVKSVCVLVSFCFRKGGGGGGDRTDCSFSHLTIHLAHPYHHLYEMILSFVLRYRIREEAVFSLDSRERERRGTTKDSTHTVFRVS